MSKTENAKAKINIFHTITYGDLGIEEPAKKNIHAGFSTWVRALMQNWRQGTVSCKGRSDVARSRKKPWKQKGTGRARSGTAGSPVWRGGGVAFGPQARTRIAKINQKQKQLVLRYLLAEYVNQGKISYIDWLPGGESPKTSAARAMLKQVGLAGKKVNLFLPIGDMFTHASFANIPHVRVLHFDQPNAVDLSHGEHWVFLKKDLDMFKGMVSLWH